MNRFLRLAARRVFLVSGPLLSLAACASTGATYGSGVGDRQLVHPPYYAGHGPDAAAGMTVAHLPVTYQRGANQADVFDPPAASAMGRLVVALNEALDGLDLSRRLDPPPVGGRRVAPDVQFNCWTDGGFPDDDCAVSGDTALGRGRQTMRLAVGRPSPEWVAWTDSALAGIGAEAVLVITLEVGSYFVSQRGFTGTKSVELGTGHVQPVPWVTSLETPVSVIQLTGAIVDRSGRALRIGAEGLQARRTPLYVSSIGGQALVTDADAEALLAARREDLPGRPSVLEVGLRKLVEGLLSGG